MTRIDGQRPRHHNLEQAPVTPRRGDPTLATPVSLATLLATIDMGPPNLRQALPPDLATLVAAPGSDSAVLATLTSVFKAMQPEKAPPMRPAEAFASAATEVPDHVLAGEVPRCPPHDDGESLALTASVLGDTGEQIVKGAVEQFPKPTQDQIAKAVVMLVQSGFIKQPNKKLDLDGVERPVGQMLAMCEGADVEALATIVMFQLSHDARDDVKVLIKDMQKKNTEKARIRQYVGQCRAQREELERQMRERYNARCNLPKGDPLRLNRETYSFEQYLQDQMILDGGMSRVGDGMMPEGSPDFTMSPNEQAVPHDDPVTPHPWNKLRHQLKILPIQLKRLRGVWEHMSAGEKAKFKDDFFTFLLAPRDLGGVGLSADPEKSQIGLVSDFMKAHGHADDDAAPKRSTVEQLAGRFHISDGQAQALHDYWEAMTPAEHKLYGNRIGQWMHEEVGLRRVATKNQDAKVRAFFGKADAARWDDPFMPASYTGQTPAGFEIGGDQHRQWLREQAQKYDLDAKAVVSDHLRQWLPQLQVVDELAKDLVTAIIKGNGGAAQAQEKLAHAINGLPPEQQKAVLEYTADKIAGYMCEVQRAYYGPSPHRVDSQWYTNDFNVGDEQKRIIGDLSGVLKDIGKTGNWTFDNAATNAVIEKFNKHDKTYFPPPKRTPVPDSDKPKKSLLGAAVEAAQVMKDAGALHQKFDAWSKPTETPSVPHTEGLAEISMAQLDGRIEEWTEKADSIGDLTNELQLKLQLGMDALSSAQQVLSNLIKKFADTSNAIIGNMK